MATLASQAKTEEQIRELEELLGIEQEPLLEPASSQTGYAVSTLSAVAAFFGVSTQAVKQWRSETPPMPGQPGDYPLDEIARWRIHRAEKTHGHRDTAKSELQREKLHEEVEERRLKNLERAGRLVDRQAAKASVVQLFHRLRSRLEAFPEEVGNSLPPDLQPDVIHDWKRKIRLLEKEIDQWSLE